MGLVTTCITSLVDDDTALPDGAERASKLKIVTRRVGFPQEEVRCDDVNMHIIGMLRITVSL